jgi:catechol-2,3-dioxygenase
MHEDAWGDFPAVVGVGETSIALFPADPKRSDVTEGPNLGFRHVAFRATRPSFDAARVELSERGVDFDFQDHEIAHSIYLNDPDGNVVEITTYEL